MADPTSLPQSTWSWIGGIVATLLAGLVGWNWKDFNKKISKHSEEISALKVETASLKVQSASFACSEDVTRDFVSRAEFKDMEVELAKMASRRELMAAMRVHREEQRRWEKQMERQHVENKDVMREIKDASLLRDSHAQAFREEMRDAIGALALKVESVSTIQKVQGAPGS
jgi:hypothetical protein